MLWSGLKFLKSLFYSNGRGLSGNLQGESGAICRKSIIQKGCTI